MSSLAQNNDDVDVLVEKAVKQIRNSAFDEDASSCVLTLMKILKNVLLSPTSEIKYRSVQLSNRSFHGKVGRVKGGIMVLEAVGFKRDAGNTSILLDSIDENKKVVWEAMKRLDMEAEALNLPNSSRPSVPTEVEIRNARNKNMVSSKAKDDFATADRIFVVDLGTRRQR